MPHISHRRRYANLEVTAEICKPIPDDTSIYKRIKDQTF